MKIDHHKLNAYWEKREKDIEQMKLNGWVAGTPTYRLVSLSCGHKAYTGYGSKFIGPCYSCDQEKETT